MLMIGNAHPSDLRIDGPGVCDTHALIERQGPGHYRLIDLNRGNGVYVNDHVIQDCLATPADHVRLGGASLNWRLYLHRLENPAEHHEAVFIGRHPSNHLIINHQEIMPLHAILLKRKETTLLVDLGSIQGTFVNGQAIQVAEITSQDRIDLGNRRVSLFQEMVKAQDFEWFGEWSEGDSDPTDHPQPAPRPSDKTNQGKRFFFFPWRIKPRKQVG